MLLFQPGIVVAIALVALAGASPALAQTGDADDEFLGFLVGEYVIVGQEPDGGTLYSGTAQLERSGDGLVLRRKRGAREVLAAGRLDVPSPPGEGRVLRFAWETPDPVRMTCLIGTDLDNYARLTCVWGVEGAAHGRPGIEALFPTAPWELLEP